MEIIVQEIFFFLLKLVEEIREVCLSLSHGFISCKKNMVKYYIFGGECYMFGDMLHECYMFGDM